MDSSSPPPDIRRALELVALGGADGLSRNTRPAMGTDVHIAWVDRTPDWPTTIEQEERIDRAFEWFWRIEACCTRFDPTSELMQLTAAHGVAVPVSDILFEVVRFAIAVAEESGGAFDPTVGGRMEARGFNREYRSGRRIHTPLPAGSAVNYRDVVIDDDRRTILLRRPLILDLGAVAKGFAIDMAARELAPIGDYAIDAGRDLYLAGHNAHGAPWLVGIADPRDDRALIATLSISGAAVCTSAASEPQPDADDEAHVLDARTGDPARAAASVTVVAPTAMAADALSTAAFILGPVDGIAFLERQGVDGMIVSTSFTRHATASMSRYYRGPADLKPGPPSIDLAELEAGPPFEDPV